MGPRASKIRGELCSLNSSGIAEAGRDDGLNGVVTASGAEEAEWMLL